MNDDFKLSHQGLTKGKWTYKGQITYGGQILFLKIPCDNCGVKFTEQDLKNSNYDLWTNQTLSWIDKKTKLTWDRFKIKYQIPDQKDEKGECHNFRDSKQLILKVCFVVTKLTHKLCNEKDP